MNLSSFIGGRYISATRGSGVVSFISVISILGIAMGVMALIVVLSVMNGVTSEVRDKLLSMTAHIKVIEVGEGGFAPDFDINTYLKDENSILAKAPFIEGQALIGLNNSYNGVQVKGIDPTQELAVSDALQNIDDDIGTLSEGSFNIIIGSGLASKLYIGVGDKITLLVPKTTVSAAGIMPRLKRFTVSGVFKSGHYLFDTGMVLINIKDAAKLLQTNGLISGYQLKLDNLFKAQEVAKNININVPSSVFAIDWASQNKSYFDAVKAEKAAMFFILLIIVMVAAFNIFSTLIMVVTDKQRDIAILQTIGVKPKTIIGIFIFQGTILGLIGTVLGVLSGIIIAKNVPRIMTFMESSFGFRLPQELYFISSLNPRIDMSVVSVITLASFALSIIATLYPAYKASKVHPARALAYE